MQTAQNFFNIYKELYFFEEGSPEYLMDKEDFITALKEYAKEAIKADRQNVTNHALVDPQNHDGYSYGSTGCQYIDPIENNDYFPFGGSIRVDKDSIINAPNIELL